jgi:hypothetical protein
VQATRQSTPVLIPNQIPPRSAWLSVELFNKLLNFREAVRGIGLFPAVRKICQDLEGKGGTGGHRPFSQVLGEV